MELNGYTNIPDWMLSFDLDVYETIILAVIYGFSQDGDSTFSGSQNYLARKAKCSRSKVARTLPKLVSIGLVEKLDRDVRGVRMCEYKVCPTATGCISQTQGGCVCGTHKNIDKENIDINTLSNKGGKNFQKPTLEEIRSYCIERNNDVDPDRFFNFYESKGWKIGKDPMKDWKASVRTWEGREKKVAPKKRGTVRTESVLEHNLRVMDELFGSSLHEQAYGNKGGHGDE